MVCGAGEGRGCQAVIRSLFNPFNSVLLACLGRSWRWVVLAWGRSPQHVWLREVGSHPRGLFRWLGLLIAATKESFR